MNVQYQKELLKFVAQEKDGRKFIPLLDATLFDMSEHGVGFELLSKYYDKYKVLPKRANLQEFFRKYTAELDEKKKLTSETKRVVDALIKEMYEPLETETTQLRESLVEFAQFKQTKKLLSDYAPKIKDGGIEVFRRMNKEMNRIVKISESEIDEAKNRGGFLLKDMDDNIHEHVEGSATYLKKLNKMTAARGFFTPQLIVIMGGPKSFKTGTMLNIAMEYVRDGKKVYWADAENGISRIRNRSKQHLLGITFDELVSRKFDDKLSEIAKRYRKLGGDFVIDFYPANTKTIADVEANLEMYKDEFGWTPDLIVYDYLDLFKPIDPKVIEKRLKIQHVYFDAINLNNKLDTFCMTLSQVRKEAVNKEVLNMKDFAEDFGKAANAHAGFALCRTEEEMEKGYARLLPVMQRDGVAYAKGEDICMLSIDEKRMLVEEVEMSEVIGELKDGKKKSVKKRIDSRKLSDE